MIPWRLYPFVRPCIFFIAGILLHEWLVPPVWTILCCICISFFLAFFIEFLSKESIGYSFFSGYVIVALFFGLGILAAGIHAAQSKFNKMPVQMEGLTECSLIGTITEIPDQRKNNKTRITSSWICSTDTCYSWSSKLIVYFSGNKTFNNMTCPAQGDRIVLTGRLSEIVSNTNPGAFDFKKYMQRQDITYQIRADAFTIIEQQQLGALMQKIMNFRNHCLRVFDKYLQGEERAIAKAMILGFRQEVEDDLYRSFSASGSMHILAVSGMHLAVIAGILLGAVKKVSKQRKGMLKLLSLLVLLVLWIFSFITGAESAIVRSAIMFSLILYGNTLRHHYSVYNIMAFCAIVMLLLQPAQIFNPGFLFSFLSLLSLLFFQPFIEGWWCPPDKFSAWVWQFVSASIAAQVLIAPLTIFMFHQFPLYFILSGFIPVWISVLALKTGLVVLCLESIMPTFNEWITFAFQFLLEYFIKSVRWVEAIPYSCLHDLYMSLPEFIFYNLALFGLMIFFRIKTMSVVIFTLFFFSLGMAAYGVKIIAQKDQRSLTVYAGKNALTDFMVGHSCFAYGDSAQLAPQAAFIYAVNRMQKGINNARYVKTDIDFFKVGNIRFTPDSVCSPQMKIYLLKGKIEEPIAGHFNAVIVTQSSWPPDSAAFIFKPYLILDASIRGKCLDAWQKFAELNKLTYYAVAQQGALTLNW